MSSSKSFSTNNSAKKIPCNKGIHCTHFPHCSYFHSPENTPACPYMKSSVGCTNPNCPFTHPKDYTRACPFMNTPAGCTNLHCPHKHPKGFIHACIFDANCKKRATGECHLLHPDERGFAASASVSQSHYDKPCNKHRDFNPRREAPPPPLPPRDTPSVPKLKNLPVKDEYGHIIVYGEDDTVIGIIDNGNFISFIVDIPLDVQKADRAWDEEIDNFDPEHPDDIDDEWETDPEAYTEESEISNSDDEWETDPDAYPEDPNTSDKF